MIRQHQFTKVELVSITTPENSKDEHERMLSCAEEVLRRLDLHYRVMTLCAGDMALPRRRLRHRGLDVGPREGAPIAKSPVVRCAAISRPAAWTRAIAGPTASALCAHAERLRHRGGRALIAVMETYQQEDGSIAVPAVLQPYMGGLKVIEKDR